MREEVRAGLGPEAIHGVTVPARPRRSRQAPVTFVFTDIEGSTRLLQELRDEYGGVARDHRRIVREAFGERGGTGEPTLGDEGYVAERKQPAGEALAEEIKADVEKQIADSWSGGIPQGTTKLAAIGLLNSSSSSRRSWRSSW